MDILRFITAGNVDDGKSTLIGRLLYDTKNLKSDVLESVSGAGVRAGANDGAFVRAGASPATATVDEINLAHITDGLRSEREQGITIDVAYKYFTTANRKYIITDAPGHFQYTRNLVTGASGVDVIIMLIDAQNGITEQTRRHLMVAAFLGIKQIVAAINKMDLVMYDESAFVALRTEFLGIAKKLTLPAITFIPISALCGDNVSFPSKDMAWHQGPTLEQFLAVCIPAVPNDSIMRFAVQHVVNKGSEDLVYGKLISGRISQGSTVVVLPQRAEAVIIKMWHGYKEAGIAKAGDNLCLSVSCDKKIARGNVISYCHPPPEMGKQTEATLCWLDPEKPLQVGAAYYLRINTQETACRITHVLYKIDVSSFGKVYDDDMVAVNEFARVVLETTDDIVYDAFSILAENGRGIIIDAATNYTAGAFTIP